MRFALGPIMPLAAHLRRRLSLLLAVCCLALASWAIAVPPAWAHWADQAAAQIWVNPADVEIDLTFPTGLTAFADSDRSNQLSPAEIRSQAVALTAFLGEKIRVSDSTGQAGALTVSPLDQAQLPPALKTAPDSHSTLRLTYRWAKPLRGIRIDYNLFLPNVPTASCLTTLFQTGRVQTFVFTPRRQTLAFTPGFLRDGAGGIAIALVTAFVWGALHSLSPGHGKTIVGAYLVGERATSLQALLLALTTTVTHTLGVFALGLTTLLAAQWILPETLYPWLSLISGGLVVSIGWNLLVQRLGRPRHWRFGRALASQRAPRSTPVYLPAGGSGDALSLAPNYCSSADAGVAAHRPHSASAHSHTYTHDGGHSHSHAHDHSQVHAEGHTHAEGHAHPHHHHHPPTPDPEHGHGHSHDHGFGAHSHLPVDTAATWRSLLALGVSGGLVPCPAALVLMLSAIAVGQIQLGLLLVVAFSLGLAVVLMGLGLLLVNAKRIFSRVPAQLPWLSTAHLKALPVLSAGVILLVGISVMLRAAFQLSQFA